jgi:Transglutaminase-like superfamily
MKSLDAWIEHSRMSDPAGHAAAIAGFRPEVSFLNDVVQGLLVHSGWLIEYGIDESRLPAISRRTLPIADRLDDILARDHRRLEVHRPPDRRAVGTCRDFALLLCSFLRCKGIPSRVRCGFASYFRDGWEDHWVCEYWDRETETWRLSDAQMDQVIRGRCRIDFDPADVPRRSFVTAGQAWSDCRSGRSDPECFGQGDVTGLWFVKVNVVRDHYVLNDRETSPWDGWRAAAVSQRMVRKSDVAWLDSIAGQPEQQAIDVSPDWLTPLARP